MSIDIYRYIDIYAYIYIIIISNKNRLNNEIKKQKTYPTKK